MEEGDPPDPDDRTCRFCKKQFSDRSNCRKHMALKRCPESKGLLPQTGGETCEACGATFSNSSNLQKHIRLTPLINFINKYIGW